MKTFETLQELIDYVPNCIICGKQLMIHLYGNVKTDLSLSGYYFSPSQHFHLKMKDNLLIGKNKNYSITINPKNNSIISNQELFDNLVLSWISVTKKCNTCRCIIKTRYNDDIIVNNKKFPKLTLTNEDLWFTRKREKSVSISQSYYDNSLLGIRVYIIINNKIISDPTNVGMPLFINFDQFKNLNSLNKRISTILTFL